MNSDERVMGGAFLGLVMFGFFVWLLSRVVAQVFHDLGMMFGAIGTAAVSFLGMAWALVKLAAILSSGAALVYAAYRHYKLVKQANEVLSAVDARCNELSVQIETSLKETEQRMSEDVWGLRRQLVAALAKPEAAPDVPKALPQPAARSAEETPENESDTTPTVSNPY